MLFGSLIHATFKARPNRFVGLAEVDGRVEECFIANPGRMRELLVPGASVYLKRCESRLRRTRWDLTLVDHGGILSPSTPEFPMMSSRNPSRPVKFPSSTATESTDASSASGTRASTYNLLRAPRMRGSR